VSQFVHLQNHSEYSMLHGAAKLDKLIDKALEYKQNALALTDHGNMFGALEFYTQAKKKNLKPIIGCDFFVAPESLKKKDYVPGEQTYHKLVLLAKDLSGYKNLMKLCSIGYVEGLIIKPRIDWESIVKHHKGLICLTGNYQGELGAAFLKKDPEKCREILSFYKDQFGNKNLYLCLQNHGLKEESEINKEFLDLHRNEDYQLVAVNDVHYVEKKDNTSHDVLLCIDGGWKLDNPDRPKFPSDEYFLKSSQEMEIEFSEYPGAISNTIKIADECNLEIEFGTLYWPKAPKQKGFETDHEYLTHLANKCLAEKYSPVTKELQIRLDYELEVMNNMKASGYMLIVEDFVNAAKKMGIPVGPGRGSAVGSLVSYVIGITDVDPIKFNLLFERFLNPERVSMPDIDIDFSDRDRASVIKYVVDKYGADSVAQIVTYGRMKAKMVLRDVGRVLGFEPQELNRICKLFPPDKPFANLEEAVASSPELKKELKSDSAKIELLSIARKLEGFVRQAGMHAAAVIIAPEPVNNFAPLFRQPGSDQLMIQYDKKYSEEIGLMKMDFLGLRNLSVIQDCVKAIEKARNKKINISHLPENDPETLELLGKGMTVGIFQFESAGMQDYLRKLKPTGIEDLIAMNALYRPGPIENIPHYIARKNGRERIDYYHPDLESILGETYGVIVYQEQVMQIAQTLSGFTLGGADQMRRAMAYKDEKKMAKLKPEFIQGAVKKGYKFKLAESIWNVLVPFSSYAFNKSHSAAYATIAYQTAYLKAHYASEFMAANMSSEINDTDRLVILLNDCKQLNIEIIFPNINKSNPTFYSNENKIIFGLAGIKNVGLSAAEKIVEERNKNGTYKSVLDLCTRIEVTELNRRAIESLIYAGALDELSGNRSQQYASVEQVMNLAAKHHRDKEMGQIYLFSSNEESDSQEISKVTYPQVDPWPYNEMLGKEKEVLGLFLSGHPLESFRMELQAFTKPNNSSLDANFLSTVKPESTVIFGGILTGLRKRISQEDSRTFAFGVLEEFLGKIEVVFWSDAYEKYKEHIELDAMILVKGKFIKETERENAYKIIAEKIMPLQTAREKLTQSLHVKLNPSGLQEEDVEKVYNLCKKNQGQCQLVIHMNMHNIKDAKIMARDLKVSPQHTFTDDLEKIAGKGKVWISNRQAESVQSQ